MSGVLTGASEEDVRARQVEAMARLAARIAELSAADGMAWVRHPHVRQEVCRIAVLEDRSSTDLRTSWSANVQVDGLHDGMVRVSLWSGTVSGPSCETAVVRVQATVARDALGPLAWLIGEGPIPSPCWVDSIHGGSA